MKGIKGDRRCYGMHSPLHSTLIHFDIQYDGTRMSNGYQKSPWYMYSSIPGAELPDMEQVIAALFKKGWTWYISCLDDKPQQGPERGTARGGKNWESYKLEKQFPNGLHTIQFVVYRHDKKPEQKDFVSVNHITYTNG